MAYTDDVVILMESAVGILSSWATNCDLGINSNKTDLVLFSLLFSLKYKIEIFWLPRLGDWELPLSSEVKYLGVVMNSNLHWKRNTEERMKKKCRNSIGKSWSFPPRTIRWIYLAIVRP